MDLYTIQFNEIIVKIMSVQINYSSKINKNLSNNSVLFVDEKFSIKNIQKLISKDELFTLTIY